MGEELTCQRGWRSAREGLDAFEILTPTRAAVSLRLHIRFTIKPIIIIAADFRSNVTRNALSPLFVDLIFNQNATSTILSKSFKSADVKI